MKIFDKFLSKMPVPNSQDLQTKFTYGLRGGSIHVFRYSTSGTLQSQYIGEVLVEDDDLRIAMYNELYNITIITPRGADHSLWSSNFEEWLKNSPLSPINRYYPTQIMPWMTNVTDFSFQAYCTI